MGSYSIKELERLSGIKAHTIRIWEKRYNLFQPKRTATNIREYSDEDLKNLLKVSTLTKSGMKISKIANSSETEILQFLAAIEDEEILNEKRVEDLIIPMIELDEVKFSKLYKKYVKELGVEKAYTKVIYPFLEKVGVLWLSNEVEPVQEHFITNLIKQKIFAAIDSLPTPTKNAKRAILFLPEGEFHELGLLYFSLCCKLNGIETFYLGQSLPIKQVVKISKKLKPNWVFTYTVVNPKGGIQQLIDELEKCDASNVFIKIDSKIEEENIKYSNKVIKISKLEVGLVLG